MLCTYAFLVCIKARVLTLTGFGGEENPERVEVRAEAGDVIVVPAGVGHRLLEDSTGNFQMVGAYSPGKQWDMCYGKQGDEDKSKAISTLTWFQRDPLYGDEGPALS